MVSMAGRMWSGTFLGGRGMKTTHTGGVKGTILFISADTPLALCMVPDSVNPQALHASG